METDSSVVMSAREKAMARSVVRLKTAEQWVEDHGPGTLRKAKKLGYAWRDMYLKDRTAHEWGWEFRLIPRSRVTFGDAYIEGDEPSLTEACWHQERYFALNPYPDSDYLEVKYIYINCDGNVQVEGVGIVVRHTSASWVPPGYIVCCIISQFDPVHKRWFQARNPT